MDVRSLVLGVDGGGTKTLGLISDQGGNILSRREVGATNPNVVGFITAARNLFQLITACCNDLPCKLDELEAIVIGLAGVGSELGRNRIHEELDRLAFDAGLGPLPITVQTDARVALEGAFEGGPGVVVIAGTGSNVLGKTGAGEIINAGGWGRILGDEGGGYHIGLEALKAVTLYIDGADAGGALHNAVARRFALDSRETIISAIYQSDFDIPSLAPLVMSTAAEGDPVSQMILRKAAKALVERVRLVVQRMRGVQNVALAMCGGLVNDETPYSNVLQLTIMEQLPQVDVRPPIHSAAHGAVLIALGGSRLR